MTDEQLLRYSRQIMLPQVDIEGQERLLESKVLIVGVGGLGSPVSMYLAAAGVGQLILTDPDTVDLSNLQRQIVHGSDTMGEAKVTSAARRLKQLNPDVVICTMPEALDNDRLLEAVQDVDVVVDCTDNLASRFAINRTCIAAVKPLVSAAAIRWEGQISVFHPGIADSPCYQCFYGDVTRLSETCSENGVIGPLLGVLGSLQALETIKLLTGKGDTLIGRVLLFDSLNMTWTTVRLAKRTGCKVCGGNAA
ncbi:MAG: molybdopterin-synthase adenylyltransferase MoeB [Thiothrix nivea]|nr:MAG: molybdopterin-synthase adenylyltransferase MoeB [Thiothrix nivea]